MQNRAEGVRVQHMSECLRASSCLSCCAWACGAHEYTGREETEAKREHAQARAKARDRKSTMLPRMLESKRVVATESECGARRAEPIPSAH